jgi:small nuclear ribonucleoprotein (snRNP)-like protein
MEAIYYATDRWSYTLFTDSLNKKVEVTFKESINKNIIGQLIGFDGCIILLNSQQNKESTNSGYPILIDLDSVCMIAVNDGDVQSMERPTRISGWNMQRNSGD